MIAVGEKKANLFFDEWRFLDFFQIFFSFHRSIFIEKTIYFLKKRKKTLTDCYLHCYLNIYMKHIF